MACRSRLSPPKRYARSCGAVFCDVWTETVVRVAPSRVSARTPLMSHSRHLYGSSAVIERVCWVRAVDLATEFVGADVLGVSWLRTFIGDWSEGRRVVSGAAL